MFAVPNDSDVCSEIPWLSTSQGERPSSDSSRKHDPEGEQEQADRERHRPHDDGATNEGWRVHPVSVRASRERAERAQRRRASAFRRLTPGTARTAATQT